jgi:hypothetical protein
MEELALNLTPEQIEEIVIDFPIIPSRGRVVITVNTDELDDLDLNGAGLSEVQYVMATGSFAWDELKAGTKVLIDLDKMSVQTGPDEYQVKLDPIKIGDRVYAFIHDSFIKAIDKR